MHLRPNTRDQLNYVNYVILEAGTIDLSDAANDVTIGLTQKVLHCSNLESVSKQLLGLFSATCFWEYPISLTGGSIMATLVL